MDEVVKIFLEVLEVMWGPIDNITGVPKTVLEARELHGNWMELYQNPMGQGAKYDSSPTTYDYFWWRWMKNASTSSVKWIALGAGMVSGAAAWWGAASLAYGAGVVAFGAGVTNTMRSAQAVGLSGAHAEKLGRLAAKAPLLSEIQVLITTCIGAKVTKGVKSTADILTFVLPEGKFESLVGALVGTSVAEKLRNYLLSKGYDFTLGKALDYTAARIHALAQGGDGAAKEVVEEIFTRRGLGGYLGGSYDWQKIIDEPAGWMAIADKLKLGATG